MSADPSVAAVAVTAARFTNVRRLNCFPRIALMAYHTRGDALSATLRSSLIRPL